MSITTITSYKEGLNELRANLQQMLPQNSLNIFDNDAEDLQNSSSQILKVNARDKAPDFKLSNAIGKSIGLYNILKTHKVVLVFYRGTWCPYCNLALTHYQSILPQLKQAGAKLIAISPQTPDESLSIKEKNDLDFEILSDNGNLVARLYTSVFENGVKPIAEMKNLGYDFDSFYADDSKEIPIPAVFIINQEGLITFAKSEGGDYRNRTEGVDLINKLK